MNTHNRRKERSLRQKLLKDVGDGGKHARVIVDLEIGGKISECDEDCLHTEKDGEKDQPAMGL